MRTNQRAEARVRHGAKALFRVVRLAAGVLLLLALLAETAWAASSTPLETLVVPNDNVYAVAIDNGKAYFGGRFTQLCPYTGGCVLVNSTGGTASGFPKVAGTVSAVVADGFGGWYIGGTFAVAGGLPRSNIAHILPNWDIDPNWKPNADGWVYALALSGNTLYVGGNFTNIGGQARSYIAALETASGDATDWDPQADSIVSTLAVSGSTVYVGGSFQNFNIIGGPLRPRYYIAALDANVNTDNATAWDPQADNWVNTLAVSGSTVYVGGSFQNFNIIGGPPRPRHHIAALDATVNTDNATAWDPNANSSVWALAVYDTTVYAGGMFTNVGGSARNYIAALDATVNINNAKPWNPGADGQVRVLALSESNFTIYAGGAFQNIGGQAHAHAAALSTSSAAVDPNWNPQPNGGVVALGHSGTDIFVGGGFSGCGGVRRNHIAQLDLATGKITEWDPNADKAVIALAVSGNTVYVGGRFSNIGGQARQNIAALTTSTNTNNATPWDPNANDEVDVLAVSGNTVYAGGAFTHIGGQARNYIAALNRSVNTDNATNWNPGANDWVQALAVSGSTVYAGGFFTQIGGQTRTCLAALDATINTNNATLWNPQADNYVFALALTGNTVYAGGGFTQIGGQARNYIAALDATLNTSNATTWNPNANDWVYALALSGNTVFAGGYFTSIGGQSRECLAALEADVATNNATSWNPGADDLIWSIAASTDTVCVGGQAQAIGTVPLAYFAAFPNHAPVVSDCTLTLEEGAPPASGKLLGDDEDKDNLRFSISYGGGPYAASASGANGTVTITDIAKGNFTYTPHHDYDFGTDTFSFTAYDGMAPLPAATLTVTINFINHIPTLNAILDQTILENAPAQTVNLSGITSGPPSEHQQVLTVTAVSDNLALIPSITVNYTSPNPTGTLSYTPAHDASGTATITVTVTDDGGTAHAGAKNTCSQKFAVNVDALKAQPQTLTTNEDTPLDITLVVLPNASAGTLYTIVTQPAHGVLSGSGASFAYIPNQDYSGSDSFSFKASDGVRDSTVATVAITVNPLPDPAGLSISPSQATVNGAGFVLTAGGSNFAPNSVVLWGDKGLSTTFVSATQLTAAVTELELAQPAVVPVTVCTPNPAGGNPGGSTSNTVNFYVYSGESVGSWIVMNTNNDGPGSLRQALAAVRAGETIYFDQKVFDLTASDAATTINVKSMLPPLDKGGVTIDAQDRRVTVNGSAAGSTDGLVIASNGNAVMGLTVLGFTGSGIGIRNCQNNTLGGSRLAGAGPNGQGLRVSNNGTYGVQITGPNATGNLVKGCWLGLSASGTDAQPNLAGLLLEGGANGNTIGSTMDGEHNAVSGNYYEGITVSGAGTDSNTIVGNIVGAAAIGETSTGRAASRGESSLSLLVQAPLGNGSAGVFLSKGTHGTKVGGEGSADGNLIAFNGANGIEVHTTDSKFNTANGNIISGNIKGGIALFEGSNEGIQAPALAAMQRLPSAVAANSVATVALTGTTSVSSGSVEVFTDSGTQGATLVSRVPVANGMWQTQVAVSNTKNITATLTDVSGNTSAFAFFGRAPGDTSANGDADGDEVSNALEALAGTDPNNAAEAPALQGAVVVDKISVALNFARSGKDTTGATLRLILPAGYVNTGASVALQFADYVEQFASLDAKGNSPRKGNATLKLKGAATAPGAATPGLLYFSVRGEDLEADWTSCGMTNKTTAGRSGEILTVPVAVALVTADGKKYVYVGSVNVVYKAVKGKTGKAERSKK